MRHVRGSTAVVAAFTLCFAGSIVPGWGQQDDGVYEMLVAGLEHRQTLVTCISGEAVEETFLSKAYWMNWAAVVARTHALVGPPDAEKQRAIDALLANQPEKEEPSTDQYDRGSFLVRFALREHERNYEAQALIWPGGHTNWGIQPDYTQPPTEAFPFYSHTSCHDGFRYSTRRGTRMPEGSVRPIELGRPAPLREPFCTWLSLAPGHILWSDGLRDDRFRVISVEDEQLGEWACYHIVRMIEGDKFITEEHLWIAPDATFAVLRTESFTIEKATPTHGYRSVRTWEDFREVEGVAFLPNLYRSDRYEYGRDTDTPWEQSTRVRIREITCVPTEFDQPFPVGVIGDLTDHAPWHHALNVFVHEPLPPDDPAFALTNAEYLRELDGSELAEMQARYGL